jgi:DNA sulfur modification protein DndB
MVPSLEADGWTVERTNKSTVRMRRPKSHDQLLEDDVWALLARIGFPAMSQGRLFKIPVTSKTERPATKQIDVLAADDESVLVVECKTAEKPGPRSMGKDLLEAQSLRGPMSQALRAHFGAKKRVGWLFATRNIAWGPADRARADAASIRVLTDNEIEYFLRLADTIGPAARHQLQAEIFGQHDVEGLARSVPAVRGRIGGRRFFQFTIEPERLLKLAFISHRARLDAETVGAYQRMLKRGRLAAIRKYIEDGGVFPTNVVVNFRNKVRFDPSADKPDGDVVFGTLYLPKTYKSAWVIDGQHRLYGFAGSKWSASMQLPVLAFEQLEPAEEAKLFVDINSKQVKVPPNLLIGLASELYWGSPVPSEAFHALLSRVVALLGTEVSSPIRGRMVQEGQPQNSAKPLTTAAMYAALKKTNLVGSIRKGVLDPGPLYEKDDLSASRRAVDALSEYLSLFASAMPEHWALGNADGGYLCTNNGITALLIVYAAVLDHLAEYGVGQPWQMDVASLTSQVASVVTPLIQALAASSPDEIRDYRRQVGNVGQRLAAFGMMQEIHKARPSFEPVGLDEYNKSQDRTGTMRARQLMPELQLRIQDATLRLLRSTFGKGDEGWWRQGVPIQVRQEVAARRELKGGELEQFFQLLDYKSIAAANWDLFKPFFKYGGGQSRDSSLAWFNPLNDIRNRTAHPEQGPVSDEELGMIEALMEHFDALADLLPPR